MKKLIRNKIPEIIKNENRSCNIYIAEMEEFKILLSEKLKEEVAEFIDNPCQEELADILEVIYALCENYGFTMDNLETIRKIKKNNLGDFSKKYILVS